MKSLLLLLTLLLDLAVAPARAAPLPWPATTEDLPTTAGDIYMANLDARIQSLNEASRRRPLAALATAEAGARYHRYRITGRIEDAEAAQALLDAVLSAQPADVDALLLRATVRAGFHAFHDAEADLALAQAAGAPPAALADARREIDLATGRYGELADSLAASRSLDGSLYELAFRGNLRLLAGDADGATAAFRAAQDQFRDSNPMPLAWLHAQQGIALLRQHRYAEAAVFLRAAHARLPAFTLATEHLAEAEHKLGRLDASRALYQRVIADTNSPEFIAALASVERDAGHPAEAAALQARATAGWEDLLARHPGAYAQHAVEFFLAEGNAARARDLALRNIALRQDVSSWLLLARARQAAGDPRGACLARAAGLASGMQPPEARDLEASGLSCGPVAASIVQDARAGVR